MLLLSIACSGSLWECVCVWLAWCAMCCNRTLLHIYDCYSLCRRTKLSIRILIVVCSVRCVCVHLMPIISYTYIKMLLVLIFFFIFVNITYITYHIYIVHNGVLLFFCKHCAVKLHSNCAIAFSFSIFIIFFVFNFLCCLNKFAAALFCCCCLITVQFLIQAVDRERTLITVNIKK